MAKFTAFECDRCSTIQRNSGKNGVHFRFIPCDPTLKQPVPRESDLMRTFENIFADSSSDPWLCEGCVKDFKAFMQNNNPVTARNRRDGGKPHVVNDEVIRD